MDTNSESKAVQTEAAAETPAEKDTGKKISFPEYLVISPAPHIRTADTTRSVMIDVIIGLLPAYAWGVFWFGLRALWIGLLSVASCILFEFLIEKILRRSVTIGDCSAAVTGLILAMNLPTTVPLWIPVVGSFFAIVVVKQLFGGIGKNVVNPAAAARVFLFVSWGGIMAKNPAAGVRLDAFGSLDVDAVAAATPLADLKKGLLPDVSVIDLLLGRTGGAIGEVASILLVAGFVWLLVRGVITWHIPVAYVAVVAILTYVFPQSSSGNMDFMIAELLSGGLLLGAIFMATDYATSPVTKYGRLIYGAGCGLITVFIRYFGGYNEGVSFAILIMNLLVWYLDRFTMPVRFGGKGVKADGNKK